MIKKLLCFCLSFMLIFSLVACVDNKTEDINIEQQHHSKGSVILDNLILDIEDKSNIKIIEEEIDETITGHWILNSVILNNTEYKLEELKDLLTEEDFDSLQLEFEFTENEVTIFIKDNQTTTGYKEYIEPEVEETNENEDIELNEPVKDDIEINTKYIDESGQLIFILDNGKLLLNQSQSTLIFIKISNLEVE